MMKRFKALSLLLIGGFLVFGGLNNDKFLKTSNAVEAANGDTHEISSFTGKGTGVLLNNQKAPATIKLSNISYPVKQVIIGWQHNKSNDGVTASVSVGTETLGTGKVGGQNATTTTTIGDGTNSLSANEITISFTNSMTGTGKGTLYINSLTLVEGTSAAIKSIDVTTMPTITNYYVGEELDTTGIVVTGTYNDAEETTADVTSDCSFSPTSFTTVNSETPITVTYKDTEITTSFNVEVKAARAMTGVELSGSMTKTQYFVGDDWDLTGLQLKVTWSDGDPTYVELNESEYLVDPISATSTSIESITIYGEYQNFEFESNYSVNVIALSVSSLKRTGSTAFFYTTDTFTFSGSIEATWNDGLVEQNLTKDSTSSDTRTGEVLSYALYSSYIVSSSTKICDIAIGDPMLASYNEKYVGINYCGKVSSTYQITVEEAIDYSTGAFYKVDTNRVDFSGTYIIAAYSSSSITKVWSGTDTDNEAISAATKNNRNLIEYNSSYGIVKFEAMTKEEINGYSIQVMNGTNKGKYIGGTSGSNKLNFNATETFNTLEISNNEIKLISNTSVFSFNNSAVASGGQRFRYYKSTTTFGTTYLYINLYEWKSNNDKATEFATGFNNANVCGTDNNTPAIASVWSEQATAFASLSTGAQNILKTGDALEGGNAIQDCLARYDRAVLRAAQRGTSSTINDFMSRISNSGTNFSIATTNNMNKLIPVIISSIAILGAASFGVLLILKRKKKEN